MKTLKRIVFYHEFNLFLKLAKPRALHSMIYNIKFQYIEKMCEQIDMINKKCNRMKSSDSLYQIKQKYQKLKFEYVCLHKDNLNH